MTTYCLSTQIRLLAGLPITNRYPVHIIGGDSQPVIKGESYGWETKTGIPIYHPTSYSRKGWSSMVYRPSTKRVEVGENWLLKQKILSLPKN